MSDFSKNANTVYTHTLCRDSNADRAVSQFIFSLDTKQSWFPSDSNGRTAIIPWK